MRGIWVLPVTGILAVIHERATFEPLLLRLQHNLHVDILVLSGLL